MDKLNQNNEIFFNNYLNFNHQEILESIDRSKRDRRLRKNKNLIKLVSEVNLNINNFIYPLFIKKDGDNEEISSMKGIYRISLDNLLKEVEESLKLGVRNFILFGVESRKDKLAKYAYNQESIIVKAIELLKKEFKDDVLLFADVCLCEYTDTGHCGVLNENNYIDNDLTLELLGRVAVAYAQAGVDFVAPSSNMDFQVAYIRRVLDKLGYANVGIMAYSAKFSSVFYSPFREAADSAPKFGDRSSYQISFLSPKQAINRILKDIQEGADIVMVKPALAYLDIIYQAKQLINVPLAAYNVSGEYTMIKNSSNFIDEERLILEILIAIKRAGADIIISYFTKLLPSLIQKYF
jgi:porphobilinogen synthase